MTPQADYRDNSTGDEEGDMYYRARSPYLEEMTPQAEIQSYMLYYLRARSPCLEDMTPQADYQNTEQKWLWYQRA